MAGKQYGLILKGQQRSAAPRPGNVFGDEDASDEDDNGTDWVRRALKTEGEKNRRIRRQTRLDMQKALNEDPTIYQYDEVYDDLERGRGQPADSGEGEQREKRSKYIQKLLKMAERRKTEQECRIERMVQKEREAEGEMYADKESFVTSAYRAKLEEFKRMEEEEAKMDRLEAIGDVTKQQDMSGFYRHLYEQTVDYKGGADKETANSEAKEESTVGQKEGETSTSGTNEEIATANGKANETEDGQRAIARSKKSRQYRQRAIETYESDSETETNKEELRKAQTDVVLPVDKKADGAELQRPEGKKQKLDRTCANTVKDIADTKDENTNIKDVEISQDNVAPKNEGVENKGKPTEKKDKSSIWEKRTVGPVFEAALQRYYERKMRKLAAAN